MKTNTQFKKKYSIKYIQNIYEHNIVHIYLCNRPFIDVCFFVLAALIVASFRQSEVFKLESSTESLR